MYVINSFNFISQSSEKCAYICMYVYGFYLMEFEFRKKAKGIYWFGQSLNNTNNEYNRLQEFKMKASTKFDNGK